MRMRQLMHSDGRAGRSVMIKIFAVNLVVSGEIIHVYQIRSDFDHILKICAHASQYLSNAFDYGPRLRPDIEMRGSELINFCASDGIVGPARTRAGDDQKIPRALHVRIFPARFRPTLNDLAFDFPHAQFQTTTSGSIKA